MLSLTEKFFELQGIMRWLYTWLWQIYSLPKEQIWWFWFLVLEIHFPVWFISALCSMSDLECTEWWAKWVLVLFFLFSDSSFIHLTQAESIFDRKHTFSSSLSMELICIRAAMAVSRGAKNILQYVKCFLKEVFQTLHLKAIHCRSKHHQTRLCSKFTHSFLPWCTKLQIDSVLYQLFLNNRNSWYRNIEEKVSL